MGLPQRTTTLKKRLKRISIKAELDPKKDPIFKLMGIADAEPFSKEIDQELYR